MSYLSFHSQHVILLLLEYNNMNSEMLTLTFDIRCSLKDNPPDIGIVSQSIKTNTQLFCNEETFFL